MKKNLLLICVLFLMTDCLSQKNQGNEALLGDWKHTNSKYNQYESRNVALGGVRFDSDSLEFFGDYMLNPMFNFKEYSISEDSITIGFQKEARIFAINQIQDTLYINDSSYTYKYVKLDRKISNEANRIEFKSRNPGWERRYFFDFTLKKNGMFRYESKTENTVLIGQLKKNYIEFIFDKLHNIELPIQTKNNEIMPHGDIFTLEMFIANSRLDSITYSNELEGDYLKWIASILQSTPLWLEDAIINYNTD